MMRRNRPPLFALALRLFLAVALLVGGLAGASSTMAHAADSSAQLAWTTGTTAPHDHDCCDPEPATDVCLVACFAATCAVPVLPGLQSVGILSHGESVRPPLTTWTRGHGPELETPPPKSLT